MQSESKPAPRALTLAAAKGDVEAMRAAQSASSADCLDAVDPACGATALHIAAAKGHVEAARWLVTQNPEVRTAVDAEGATALERATADRLWRVCGVVAEHIDDLLPGRSPRSALQNALIAGDAETALWLLGEGGSAAALAADGSTALHVAATSGALDADDALSQALLASGARALEAPDRNHVTALHAAVLAGREGAVARLVAAGAKTNTTDSSGETLLQSARELAYDDVGKRVLALVSQAAKGPD